MASGEHSDGPRASSKVGRAEPLPAASEAAAAEGESGSGVGEGSDQGEAARIAEAETVPAALERGLGATVSSSPDLERRVALTRLKNRLFAREAAVTLGRYHLLEMVGKGGMGVVWGAWDPELERRVAVKVLKPTISAARERMLIEGQALARLSHPNVVPIYDVGVIDEQVYLVMEWVRGQSLRAFASEPRTVRELVAVYRQAGEGLAAAHRAGLIHRDFKPDNAIRGEDGRVRVLDFGLARGEVADPSGSQGAGNQAPAPGGSQGITKGAGTPLYMAPEQATGDALTAAADQYALCVSLREALLQRHGAGARATVPRWLSAVLDRGSSVAPELRFADMAALLRALDQDPVRVWRRRGLAMAAVVAAVAAFALGRARSDARVDPCTGGKVELVAVWTPAVRASLVAHLDGLGDYGREQAPRAASGFDHVAVAWTAAYRQACKAHQRSELPAELYQRRLGCLARTKVALGTAAELLSAVAREGLDNALIAARSLPDAGLCAEQDAAQIAPPSAAVAPGLPPIAAAIEKARILAVAVRPEAAEAATAAVTRAEATAYGPILARAELTRGRAEAGLAHWEAAAKALRRAVDTAVVVGDDVVAVEAFARLVFVASRSDRPVDGVSIIERLAQRTGTAGSFARALLYNNLATMELARADRVRAREWLGAAQREIDARHGEIDLELTSVAQNLALVAEQPKEREQRASAVVTLLEGALGGNHAKTLGARLVEANETANFVAARVRFVETCERYRRFQPHLAAAMSDCYFRLGWLLHEAGELAPAREAMLRAVGDPSKARLQSEIAEHYAAAMGADQEAARFATTALLTMVEQYARDPQFWKRIAALDAAAAAAAGLIRWGSAEAAQRAWSRAREIGEQLDPPLVQRRLAGVRAAQARRLFGSDPAGARTLAQQALRWYRHAGGYDALVAELTTLAAE
jgi:eukaryotic-like serine/threonine-protein kinase